MPKNILIFSDGTGQAGGLRPDQHLSNIYKLFRATRTGPDSHINPADQVAFYDPGLGTTTEAGFVHLKLWDVIKAMAGSIAGLGISKNVADCYEAILKRYEPGDRIYLFGFSRGAYTARSLAGVLYLCGIPTRSVDGSALPRSGHALRSIAEEAVRKVYDYGAGKPRNKYEVHRAELGRRFREKYGAGDAEGATVHPYFIGLFDAVASLGLPDFARGILFLLVSGVTAFIVAGIAWLVSKIAAFDFLLLFLTGAIVVVALSAVLYAYATLKILTGFPNKWSVHSHFARWRKQHYDTFLDPRVDVVRHGMAIDERRKDFARVIWGGKANIHPHAAGELEPFVQLWFAGNHSDIGGSYPEDESRLSDISLTWMVQEATSIKFPILLEETKLNLFPDAAGVQHCESWSLRDKYRHWWSGWIRWPVKYRDILSEAQLHPSVQARFALDQVQHCDTMECYRPAALQEHAWVRHYYQTGEPKI